MRYKVTSKRSSGARRVGKEQSTLGGAKKVAKKFANRYNKGYYIYKYTSGKPERRQYPFWTYVETVFPSKKKKK